MIQVTEADILAELERVGTAPEDAMTMMEIVDATGYSRAKVRQDMSRLFRAGRLLVHRVVRRKMDGRTQIVPAYTIAPKPKRKR